MVKQLVLVFVLLSILSIETSEAQTRSGKEFPPIDRSELVSKVIKDIQLRHRTEEIIHGSSSTPYFSPATQEGPDDFNYIVLDSGEEIVYLIYASMLEWHSLSTTRSGEIDLQRFLSRTNQAPPGEHTQPAPIIYGLVFLFGSALSTAQCSYLQSECFNNCMITCPCGAGPSFSCVGLEGIANCTCNCYPCDQLDPANLAWPTPSPIGGIPYVQWDYGSNQPWQLVVGGGSGPIDWLTK
jgi:hypothetical protein